MSEPKIVLPVAPPAVDKVELLKSHVAAYTRKDGAVVQAHDDKRPTAASKYDHPNVVGKAEKLQGGDASKAHGMSFAGKEFSASGKEGTSFHDDTPVRHFTELSDEDDSGEHVWMDHKGRVHADGTTEVPRLRKMNEAHVAKSALKAKK